MTPSGARARTYATVIERATGAACVLDLAAEVCETEREGDVSDLPTPLPRRRGPCQHSARGSRRKEIEDDSTKPMQTATGAKS